MLTVLTDVASQGMGSGQAHRSTPPTSSPSSLGVTRIKIHPEKKKDKKVSRGLYRRLRVCEKVISKCCYSKCESNGDINNSTERGT